MTVRLREFHEKEVVPRMMKEFKYFNKMQVPRFTKIRSTWGFRRLS